ncbi:hypothetical protein F5883DRAFT_556504 [Diaporthe sp. PMI_573]|nr:hypothetical protein F5883DRAFT_556504 [Diaporthaceae sp. PMI_573]
MESMVDNSASRSPQQTQHTLFWVIMLSLLSLLGFISALDVTIIPPALPMIVQDIGGSTQYIWIANVFVFASSAFQPLFGQLANIVGRCYPLAFAIALFIINSSLAGGAYSSILLIVGCSA